MNAFSYLPGSPFIVSIGFLIVLQSYVYFVNTSLFLSVEAKIISFHYFLQSIHLQYQKEGKEDLRYEY